MLPIPPFVSILIGAIFPIALSAWLTRSWMRHQVEALGPAAGSGTDSAEASEGMKRADGDGPASVFAAVRGPAAWLLLTSLVAMAIQVVFPITLMVNTFVNTLLPVLVDSHSMEYARPHLLAMAAPLAFTIPSLLLAAKAVRELDLGRLQVRFRCRSERSIAVLVGLWLASGSVMLIKMAADALRAGSVLFGNGSLRDLQVDFAGYFATPRSIHGPIQMFLLPLLALFLTLRLARRLEPEILQRTEASTSMLSRLAIHLSLAGYVAAGLRLLLRPLGVYWEWWFFDFIDPGLAGAPIVRHVAGLFVGLVLALYVLGPARQMGARLGLKGVISGLERPLLFLALSAVMAWPADYGFHLYRIYNIIKMSDGAQSGGHYSFLGWVVSAVLVWMLFIYRPGAQDSDGH
jgi:hypothetical protein